MGGGDLSQVDAKRSTLAYLFLGKLGVLSLI